MQSAERRYIPDWAQKERSSDLLWIGENLYVFWPAAQQGFQESGRGALVIDTHTLVKHERGESNPFGYVPSEEVERHGWREVTRMLAAYDPSWEFVAVLLKGERESAYRVSVPSQRS